MQPARTRRSHRRMPRLVGEVVALTLATAVAVWLHLSVGLLPAALWVYPAMSVVAFVVYGLDKRAAVRRGARIPEATLLTLGLLGGWPGAMLAQELFRHKTIKPPFRLGFWASVYVNIALVAAVHIALGDTIFDVVQPGW